jgi:hypothetical protein
MASYTKWSVIREPFLKGKAQYLWPPSTSKFRSAPYTLKNLIIYCTKQATLMRRSTVLSLPLQSVFPGCYSVHAVREESSPAWKSVQLIYLLVMDGWLSARRALHTTNTKMMGGVINSWNLGKIITVEQHVFLVKWVPGQGPEQRESEKTVLYLQIIIMLISYVIIFYN